MIWGPVFYSTPNNAESFFQRGAALFFAIMLNAFESALEILILYQQRPIVEKQSRYAMYHPSAEALASMLADMPYKITNAIVSNATSYFLANLRREPGNFFIFLFVNSTITLTMSMLNCDTQIFIIIRVVTSRARVDLSHALMIAHIDHSSLPCQ